MNFSEPNRRVRLGSRKLIRIKRGQDIVESFAWLSVVAVIAMFLIDSGVEAVQNTATLFSSLSRLLALIATDLLLIHMLLIARVPWIDKLYGHDRATLAHKKLGKPILYLLLAHFAASTANYVLTAKQETWAAIVSFITDVPDMLTAFISLVLFVLVVITSINFARRHLSYEAWYLVHLLSYAAVMLAIPHQFSTGSDIAGKPVATFFWVSLYIFVAGNILWFRFLSPLAELAYFDTRISKVVRESSDSVSIYISGKNLEKLGHTAGQFYIVRILTKKLWWRAHPFSVSAAPNSKFLRFTVGKRGDDTAEMQTLQPGARVILEGPYGIFTEARRTREKVTLIAAGIGAPPIRALAEQMAARPGDVTVIYRVRDKYDAPLVEEMRELCRRRGFTLHVLEGQRGNSKSWMPADPQNIPDHARLSVMAPWVSESDVFICGPSAWTQTVQRSLLKAGVSASHIHAEEFAW